MHTVGEPCNLCGGDGRISNAFGGGGATCPGCHGSGRRAPPEGFHDVTKTKPSHHLTAKQKQTATVKSQRPHTFAGEALAKEIDESSSSAVAKARMIRETMDHEDTHGQCTQTFIKKIRKVIRSA